MSYNPTTSPDFGLGATEILADGSEGVFNRLLCTSTSAGASNGNFRGPYFKCRKSQTITKIRTVVGGTNQVGATLCRIGLYTVDASDNLTLVASTANDTTLWNTTNTVYETALSSSYAVTRGVRYAIGMLVVGSSQAPGFLGFTLGNSAIGNTLPRTGFLIGSQTDLPSSISVGSMTGSNVITYAALVP
jgi:hypothetical protein